MTDYKCKNNLDFILYLLILDFYYDFMCTT